MFWRRAPVQQQADDGNADRRSGTSRRVRARRLFAAGLCVAAGATLFVRLTGVSEVHRTVAAIRSRAPLALTFSDDDWPCWGGSRRSNIAQPLPCAEWSPGKNILWHTAIPGRGHASPCAWGKQVFLLAAEGSPADSISLICVDRETGRIGWQTPIHRGGLMTINAKNSHASSTPACDGRHVFCVATVQESLRVTAVDLDGHVVWQREAGPYRSKEGYGSSPVLYDRLVIVAGDNSGQRIDRLVGSSYLAALDRTTGEIVWRVRRTQGDSYGTPIFAAVAGRDQLILSGKEAVTSYDPGSGERLWTCRWAASRAANSVACDDQCVYATTKSPQAELLCIRADGHGDVTDTHVRWSEPSLACDVPSPLVYDARLYLAGDNGVLSCVDTQTGKALWKRRLGGRIFSSPVLAGTSILCTTEEGTTFASQLGNGLPIAQNSLDDPMYASPVIAGGRLFMRTQSGLWCIGQRVQRKD